MKKDMSKAKIEKAYEYINIAEISLRKIFKEDTNCEKISPVVFSVLSYLDSARLYLKPKKDMSVFFDSHFERCYECDEEYEGLGVFCSVKCEESSWDDFMTKKMKRISKLKREQTRSLEEVQVTHNGNSESN